MNTTDQVLGISTPWIERLFRLIVPDFGDNVPTPMIRIRNIKEILRLKLDGKLSHEQIATAQGIYKVVVT